VSPEGGAEQKIKPATARVFFALWPSPALASELVGLATVAAERYGGRSSRPDTIHLTLAFLGEVPESALPTLCALAASIKAPPFELVIDRLGFWPHNHLLWAGCSTTPVPLQDMVLALQKSLIAAGFNPDRADRPFTPHLTLLRKVPVISSPATMNRYQKFPLSPGVARAGCWCVLIQTLKGPITSLSASFCWLDGDVECFGTGWGEIVTSGEGACPEMSHFSRLSEFGEKD
jgi:2'-5' RNA ligase